MPRINRIPVRENHYAQTMRYRDDSADMQKGLCQNRLELSNDGEEG
jgi:hypothetical protein